jgi:hypothetical protein
MEITLGLVFVVSGLAFLFIFIAIIISLIEQLLKYLSTSDTSSNTLLLKISSIFYILGGLMFLFMTALAFVYNAIALQNMFAIVFLLPGLIFGFSFIFFGYHKLKNLDGEGF